MAKRLEKEPDSKQPKQWSGWQSVSDWYVVRLPPVQPLDGWQEYFGLLPEKAAA
jgi:hypothetical protein